MSIELVRVERKEAETYHARQVRAFTALLDKYQDRETNPACEPLTSIIKKLDQINQHLYLILADNQIVGGITVVITEEHHVRIGPVMVDPLFQKKGFGFQAMKKIEEMYQSFAIFELDTIKQEESLVSLYTNLGYKQTGKEEKLQPNMTIIDFEKRI